MLMKLTTGSPIFYEQLFQRYSLYKKVQTQSVNKEMLSITLSLVKVARKMLVKLTRRGFWLED
jgi:hypothetical protein